MKWTLTFIDKCFHVCADATKTLFFFLLRKIANSFSYDTKKCKLYVKEDTITSLLTFARNLSIHENITMYHDKKHGIFAQLAFFLVLLVSSHYQIEVPRKYHSNGFCVVATFVAVGYL